MLNKEEGTMSHHQFPQVPDRIYNLKNAKGHTMVETAFLLLPFMVLLSAVMEFGWYYLHQHTLQFATREGMRMATVGGVLTDSQGAPMSREDSIIKTIQENASWVMDIPTGNIKIFQVGDNYSNPAGWETAMPNAGNPADYMRVVVQYDHRFFTPLVGHIFSDDNSIQMQAQGTYRNELFDVGV